MSASPENKTFDVTPSPRHPVTLSGPAVSPPPCHRATPSCLPRRLRLPQEGLCWLLVVVALTAGGWLRGMNLVLLLAYFMLAIWGMNYFLAGRGLRRLLAKRRIHGPVFAQTSFTFDVVIRNPRRRALHGVRLEDRGPAHSVQWFLPQVLAGKEQSLEQSLTLPSRGRYAWGPLWSHSSYPFGLVRRDVELVANDELIVLPRVGRLHRGRLRRLLAQAVPTVGRVRRQLRRCPMAQTEFHGLRAFRSGDSPRFIHWRTSARRGELMVREFEEAPTDNLVLILDPCRAAESEPRSADRGAPYAGAPRSALRAPHDLAEEAISLTATICWEWCRQKGDRLVLATAGALPVVLDGVTSREHALRLLEHLALIRGGPNGDVGRMLDELVAVELPVAPVLLITTQGGRLADLVAARLHRLVTTVDVSDLEDSDFYESPWPVKATSSKPVVVPVDALAPVVD